MSEDLTTHMRPSATDNRSDRRLTWLLGGATAGMGLLSGLFYGYACSVMPGLAKSDDRTLVDAMQQINKAIENPVFFATFVGAPALALGALVIERRWTSREALRWIALALVLAGIDFAITGGINIPLNNDLAAAGDPAGISDLAGVRDHFEGTWVVWNIVRTVATTASFGALGRALWIHARRSGR
ncbi:MAG: Protein of unknown function transrane [Jatrophihabitans sp.]|nr:Protein of unknown function transrane [Jatrophihabitans sp.]